MIEYKTGNILASDAEVLVNTVNCVGVMGRGIALQFKQAFPDNFHAYAAACSRGEVQPGRMFVQPVTSLVGTRYIVNFPTKRHWRGASRMEDIESGLVDLVRFIREQKVESIAIPPLGAGLGGLNWPEVRQRIQSALSEIGDVEIVVYEPDYEVTSMPRASRKPPKMTAGRASLVSLMDAYVRGLMQPDVSLLEIHKLMFFLQEAGQPLRLAFVKAAHGPYAENLRHVLNETEGTLTAGYLDGGDSPTKKITLVPGALKDADDFLANEPLTVKQIVRVRQLVEGFETSFGLELLATVYWLLAQDATISDADLLGRVHDWDKSKVGFELRHVQVARQRLVEAGWIAR